MILRLFVMTFIVVAASGVVLTQESFLPGFDPATRIYVIRPGDTLWDLAGKAFQDPWKWPRIWFNNPRIENPHRIYPGDPLIIPRVEGASITPAALPPPPPPPPPEALPPSPEVEVKPQVSPPPPPSQQPPVAKIPAEAPPPTEIAEIPFISGEPEVESRLLVEEKAVPQLPPGLYVRLGNEGIVDPAVKPLENEILGGLFEDREIFALHDLLYLSNRNGNLKVGDRLYVYRDQGELEEPETGRVLGRWIVIRGVVEVSGVEGEIAQALVVKSFDPIEKEDHLLPYKERPKGIVPGFNPQRITGTIVALPDRHTIVGPYQIIYGNLGSTQGVREGDFVEIYRKEAPRTGKRSGTKFTLPSRLIGKGVVVEIGSFVATILVVSANTDIQVGDILTTAQPLNSR